MAHLRTIVIAAVLAGIAGVSFATAAQAENRHGTMPSRMMMKRHAMGHHYTRHHYRRHRRM